MENKIPNVSNLVKKAEYNAKISEIEKKITDHNHDKYITTPEFNKVSAEIIAARLKQANLASKSDIANLVNKTDFDNKLKNLNKNITSSKTKNVLDENEFKKLQTFDSILFIGQTSFNKDGAQLYLIFQPIYKTITTFSDLSYIISEWKSKVQSNENFKPPYTANESLPPKLLWNKSRLRLRFEGSCLKQGDTAPFTPNNVESLVIDYKLETWSQDLNAEFTLKDCFFGNVQITKNADPDKYS